MGRRVPIAPGGMVPTRPVEILHPARITSGCGVATAIREPTLYSISPGGTGTGDPFSSSGCSEGARLFCRVVIEADALSAVMSGREW